VALTALDKIVKPWGGYRKAVTDAAVIRRFVRQHGPFDGVVAQCEEPDGLSCALASLAGSFPPLVTQVHDLRYRFDGNEVHFIKKSSLGFIFKRSARVVANSFQTAGWLRNEYGVPEDKMGQLASQLPGWTFALVGPETSDDPAFREELKKIAADPLLAQRVEWLGRLESTAVIDQIRRARVVVCPSRIETFSRTTIEALALGRPVIVSKTTGAAFWVKSTRAGSVVPPNDPEALARAILDWTKRKAPPSSETVCSQLTASQAADDLIAEIKKAIASRRP
jgi:hypothetical protein